MKCFTPLYLGAAKKGRQPSNSTSNRPRGGQPSGLRRNGRRMAFNDLNLLLHKTFVILPPSYWYQTAIVLDVCSTAVETG